MGVWGLLRRLLMPVVDQYSKRFIGVPAENRAHKSEYVNDVDATPADIRDALIAQSNERWEVSVLAGLKTDWAGNKETASLVCYQGSRPTQAAPDWLRHDQIHVFMFSLETGTRVCCHREANSWRPDLWRDHLYKGPSFDPQAGVGTVETWLHESTLPVPVTDPNQ